MDFHSAPLRYAICRALIPKNQPPRTGVWVGNLYTEVSSRADFESYLDFCFEILALEKVGLLKIERSAFRKGPDPRTIYPHRSLVETMRIAG